MEEIKQINVGGVDYNIVSESAETKIAELDNKIKSLEDGATSEGITPVIYSELKALRDNGQLLEGHLYRITDYITTTTQTETKSANHPFDIIVLATSTNELSHIARAIQHDGDTYFDGNDLGAWELWYDLDNDATKYGWADATNGKGVIYRMIDDKKNDCPYDFKNILFYNTALKDDTTSDKYYYSFSYVVGSKLYDGTVEKQITSCYGNSMKVYANTSNRKSLNHNVFRNIGFTNSCSRNTLGNNCYDNTVGYGCTDNTFDSYCFRNTLGNSCSRNTLGNNCQYNTLGNNCSHNTFGDFVSAITMDYNCSYNTLGNYCSDSRFTPRCQYNTLGNKCQYNTFGNYGSYNILGDQYSSRSIYVDKTSITLNDEYYDDGSGQLVPTKHPDLSTQPSILPYKFMGQYVYEQLIPNIKGGVVSIPFSSLAVPNPLIIEATSIANVKNYNPDNAPLFDVYGDNLHIQTSSIAVSKYVEYFRIIYTSMPEEGGDYYGYNNY